jgi:hypothetical protein
VGARLTQALVTAEINRYYGCALGLNETLDMDESFVDELLEVARALTSGAK